MTILHARALTMLLLTTYKGDAALYTAGQSRQRVFLRVPKTGSTTVVTLAQLIPDHNQANLGPVRYSCRHLESPNSNHDLKSIRIFPIRSGTPVDGVIVRRLRPCLLSAPLFLHTFHTARTLSDSCC